QVAATLAQAGGTRVETIRHRELDARLLETAERLGRAHRTVWLAIDGIYSMYGDLAPLGLLRRALDAVPNLRLYVDDAHGMSWAGEHGRGWFLSRFPLSERVVLGTSLVKAYAAGGGAFVFASAAERERVRLCGGPYVFSGPLQPPMLGAALGSARVHLSDEIGGLQRAFAARASLTNTLLREHGLPLLVRNEGPIFFLRMGRAEAAMTVAERMMEEGWHVTISTFPSVPQRRAGIRLAVTALHTPAEIRGVVEALARHVPRALAEHGISSAELDELYRDAVPAESWGGLRPAAGAAAAVPAAPVAELALPAGWRVEVADSVAEVDRAAWDACMAGRGASSWDALRMAESLFGEHQPRPEHRWRFRYLVVRRADGSPVAATYFSRCLHKDDMFSDVRVSAEVERRRAADPYLLSSTVVTLGSYLSEGDHLYLDRADPAWPAALAVVHAQAMRAAREWGASAVVLRDLRGDDREMDAWMGARDFVKMPLMSSYRLDARRTEEAVLADASKRTRRFLRELADASAPYREQVWSAQAGAPTDPAVAAHLYRLYLQVAERGLRINTFPLPESVVPALLSSPAWEVVALTLEAEAGGPGDGLPVAWFAGHRAGGHYAVFMCGVDYAYVAGTQTGAYRQLLLRMARRAREVGAHTLHLGMDAETEKQRFGAVAHPTCAYVLALEHDAGDQLQAIVTRVGLGAG
ncbi:MAG TPA: aminotransferase class I/II-fold pyridoxal phosphate-dependent enzyme, partial [Longimicrobium sp.]|nr:aminotransferase class I/II-fold pyridoxal phosphate-dependent enzyme [Longimicrobium sp.]